MKVFFYPYTNLRGRQLDTIRGWNSKEKSEALNVEFFLKKVPVNVVKDKAIKGKIRRSWKQIIPLINIKRAPSEIPKGSVLYVWGAICLTQDYIVDLDNPYSLVGYNVYSMKLWRFVIKRLLLSKKCREIRCLSEACRESVRNLFGADVYRKTTTHYPVLSSGVCCINPVLKDAPVKFLFIGTQFEIKGGVELVKAFILAKDRAPNITLDIVTYLPEEYLYAKNIPGITVHDAVFSRKELWDKFMKHSDVLVHPSYMESFGMVVLEAISHGLAVIANDVYAHKEMIIDGENGFLLEPPVLYWENGLAGPLFYNQHIASEFIRSHVMDGYVQSLSDAITALANDRDLLDSYKQSSLNHYRNKFYK